MQTFDANGFVVGTHRVEKSCYSLSDRVCHKSHVFVMGEDESDVMLLHANYANVCISKFHVLISC